MLIHSASYIPEINRLPRSTMNRLQMTEWTMFEIWLSAAVDKFGDLAIHQLGYLPQTPAMKRYAFIVGFNLALEDDPDLVLQHLSLMPEIPQVMPEDAMPHDEMIDRLLELTSWEKLVPSPFEELRLASDLHFVASQLELSAVKLETNSSVRPADDYVLSRFGH